MKKLIRNILFVVAVGLTLAGCNARKKIVYVQNAEDGVVVPAVVSYEMHIKPDDQLNIIVNSSEPELAAPFNMALTQRAFAGTSTTVQTYSGGSPQIFWVDADGYIDYPYRGKFKVEGMTRYELAKNIEQWLISEGHIQDPIVNVTFSGSRISVLGEVTRPGQFTMSHDRVSIFDAIAMAGDLTIYGERDKVNLYREEVEGEGASRRTHTRVHTFDLRDAAIFNDSCFYLRQNDIIYVEPNASKASNREVSSLYSFAISLTSLALTIATFIRSFQ